MENVTPEPVRRMWHVAFDGMVNGGQAMGAVQYATDARGLTSQHLAEIVNHVRTTNHFDSVRISFFGELAA